MAYFVYRDDIGRYHYISARRVDNLEEVVLTCLDEEDARERVASLNRAFSSEDASAVLSGQA